MKTTCSLAHHHLDQSGIMLVHFSNNLGTLFQSNSPNNVMADKFIDNYSTQYVDTKTLIFNLGNTKYQDKFEFSCIFYSPTDKMFSNYKSKVGFLYKDIIVWISKSFETVINNKTPHTNIRFTSHCSYYSNFISLSIDFRSYYEYLFNFMMYLVKRLCSITL